MTDPGIVPSKKEERCGEEVLQEETYNNKGYFVEYLSKRELDINNQGSINNAQKFYDLKKYKYNPAIVGEDGKVDASFDKSNKHLQLSYCTTC